MIKRIFILVLIFLNFFTLLKENSYSDETLGKELFEEKRCVRCHTIGRGKFVGPDLFNIKVKYSEEEISAWIQNPQTIYQKLDKMPVNQGYPPMPNLNISETDAEDITDFLIYNKIKKTDKPGGTIAGYVINKTTSTSAEGIDVYLQSYIGDRKTGEKLSITDEKGVFNFKDLKWDNSYSIKINSSGVEYETDKMVFPPEEELITLNLPIFEASADDAEIIINTNHEVISIEQNIVTVAEVYEFENIGNSIYIGEKEPGIDINKTLKFNIPKEAQNLSFVQGINRENIVRAGNTVFDTVSVPPGKKRVVITYELPLKFGTNQINKDFYYSTKAMLMLATESKSNITVTGLNELEPVFIDNHNYLRWIGENIKPGTKIKINYYSTSLKLKSVELYPIIIFTFIFISAVILSLFGVYGKNKRLNSEDLLEKRKKIITEIAELDIKHENDEIDADKYKIIRSELKKSLLLIDDMIKNFKYPRNKTEQ